MGMASFCPQQFNGLIEGDRTPVIGLENLGVPTLVAGPIWGLRRRRCTMGADSIIPAHLASLFEFLNAHVRHRSSHLAHGVTSLEHQLTKLGGLDAVGKSGQRFLDPCRSLA